MDDMGRILKGLLKRTEGGQLKWRASAEGNTYIVAVDTAAVALTSLRAATMGLPDRYRLDIFNDKSIPVESLESPDPLGSVPIERRATGEQSGEMSRLFILARRSALDTDSTLRKLAESLENSP